MNNLVNYQINQMKYSQKQITKRDIRKIRKMSRLIDLVKREPDWRNPVYC